MKRSPLFLALVLVACGPGASEPDAGTAMDAGDAASPLDAGDAAGAGDPCLFDEECPIDRECSAAAPSCLPTLCQQL